jgi:sugar phosphate isomerase/epimerase
MRRRDFIGAIGVGAPLAMAAMGEAQTFTTPEAVSAGSVTAAQMAAFDSPPYPEKGNDVKPAPRKGRIKQAATPGVFTARAVGAPAAQQGAGPQAGGMEFEEMCRQAVRLGLKGFDLIDPPDWPTLKKYGLVSTMMWGIGMGRGRVGAPRPTSPRGPGGGPAGPLIVDKEAHDHFVQVYSDTIDLAGQNGVPNIIMLTGTRGKSTEENADNLVALLNSLKARAEDKGVTLCPELQDDPASWLFGIMQRVNSPRCKVLFDIYHAQVNGGDIVNNIRQNFQWIGHFHTGGNPPVTRRPADFRANAPGTEGRNELDNTQELYWPFIAKAIADMGFTDFLTHEYTPAPGMDPIASLEKCIRICDA